MIKTGDLRIDKIMPKLKDSWLKLPFENCLKEKTGGYKKLKKKDLKKDQGLEEETEEEDYSFIPDSLQDPEFISAWKEWEVHRKQIKHKLTPLTQKKQLKKLSSVPLKIAIHTIEQSIEKGWQGLFIPKESDPIWQEADMQDTGDSGGEWDMFFEHFDRSKRRDPEPPF